jgi:tRNA 2-thiouridine synthesizing protein A
METVDLRGVSCPANYVRVRLALELLTTGEEIEVLLDSGEPVRNVPRSVKDDGDQVLSLAAEEDHYRMRVRKGAAEDA